MMRRRGVVVIVAGAAVLLGTGCAQAAAARAAGSWGRAIAMPGLGPLNKGGNADVSSVSCASPGNCSAGGYYTDGGGHQQGFVVSEQNGRWGKAIEVPGLGALNKGRNAQVLSVSCASPGNCAAGGYYGNRSRFQCRHGRGFVVSERNGGWGKAIEVPGLAALNKYGQAVAWSVSCASAGSCAAGGSYEDSSGFTGSWPSSGTAGGQGDRGARPGGAEQGRVRRGLVGVVRLGGQLRGRGSYWDRRDHTRGSWPTSGTASGARRSRCPAWRP